MRRRRFRAVTRRRPVSQEIVKDQQVVFVGTGKRSRYAPGPLAVEIVDTGGGFQQPRYHMEGMSVVCDSQYVVEHRVAIRCDRGASRTNRLYRCLAVP